MNTPDVIFYRINEKGEKIETAFVKTKTYYKVAFVGNITSIDDFWKITREELDILFSKNDLKFNSRREAGEFAMNQKNGSWVVEPRKDRKIVDFAPLNEELYQGKPMFNITSIYNNQNKL